MLRASASRGQSATAGGRRAKGRCAPSGRMQDLQFRSNTGPDLSPTGESYSTKAACCEYSPAVVPDRPDWLNRAGPPERLQICPQTAPGRLFLARPRRANSPQAARRTDETRQAGGSKDSAASVRSEGSSLPCACAESTGVGVLLEQPVVASANPASTITIRVQ